MEERGENEDERESERKKERKRMRKKEEEVIENVKGTEESEEAERVGGTKLTIINCVIFYIVTWLTRFTIPSFFAVIGMMVHVRFWFMFHDDVLGGEEREIRKKSGGKKKWKIWKRKIGRKMKEKIERKTKEKIERNMGEKIEREKWNESKI